MMAANVLGLILWLSTLLAAVCADDDKEFSGTGYLVYDLSSRKISSVEDEIKVNFRTIQPTGMLVHGSQSGSSSDYVTLELVGGRFRYSARFGKYQDLDDVQTGFLGKDLNDGKPHSVVVVHVQDKITVTLDDNTSGKDVREFKTKYNQLDLDRRILVGGASNFQTLQGVESRENFIGCLSTVTMKLKDKTINFLQKDVVVPFGVDMDKACSSATYAPFTFKDKDSSFIFTVNKKDTMTGSFKFRTYLKDGTLLKQSTNSGKNGFEISYNTGSVVLTVSHDGSKRSVSIMFQKPVNSGNWHNVEFTISGSTLTLGVNDKNSNIDHGFSFSGDFFGTEVTAGGYIGCMVDLVINKNPNKPDKDSNIKNVEWESCNITDFCTWKPCLHGGNCEQDGKSFKCTSCSGYNLPVCQFPKYAATCDILKRKDNVNTNGNWTIDVDGPGPLAPFKAFCNMTAVPATTEIISLSQRVKITVHPDSAGKAPLSVHKEIRYFPKDALAKALAQNSESCRQYIEYGCKKSRLLNVGGGTSYGNWVSRDGIYQKYWGGANPESRMCACGIKGDCLGGKKCNCDARQDIWSSDEGWLYSDSALPVSQLVLGDLSPELGSEGNYTVGNLICSGEVSNAATFVNEDGMIRLDKPWTPPSDGVISFFFKTPYKKGVLLFNGDLSKEYFELEILNETTVQLTYDIGHGSQRVSVSLDDEEKVSDREWHHIIVYRNMLEFGLHLDSKSAKNILPLFLRRDLDIDTHDKLVVGGFPTDVSRGFVGVIRGLTINGEVIDLKKEAEGEPYVKPGIGAACPTPNCKQGGTCVDDYNVYRCDCSKTPFYGYFCHKDYGATFERDSQLIYKLESPVTVPGVDIVVGFKFKSKDDCYGDIIKITSADTNQMFLLAIDSLTKNLTFSFVAKSGDGSVVIGPPEGRSYCDGQRHTVHISRWSDKLYYTVDGGKVVTQEKMRLEIAFSKMEGFTIGSKEFNGCLTGVKVTGRTSGQASKAVEPIKAFVYDGETYGITASGVTRDSKAKCGEEPQVGPIPTPRNVGGPLGGGGTTTAPPGTPDSGQRTDEDNKVAIIVVVVLILVLIILALVLVFYFYWARHKGEYHTHEDDEVLKSTDPYINLAEQHNPAAQESEKKKEWYI